MLTKPAEEENSVLHPELMLKLIQLKKKRKKKIWEGIITSPSPLVLLPAYFVLFHFGGLVLLIAEVYMKMHSLVLLFPTAVI